MPETPNPDPTSTIPPTLLAGFIRFIRFIRFRARPRHAT